MPYDGNGTFNRLHNWSADAANAVDINATEMDGEDNGFAAALSNAVTRDGQGKMGVDFLPNADNTLNLGSGTLRWASVNGIPIASIISGIFYARTAAEALANVTPTVFTFPELMLERYGGGISAAAAVNNAALTSAISVAGFKGGGVIQLYAAGTYAFSNAFVLPAQTTLQGIGYGTILNYTGSGSFITLNSTSSRAGLSNLILKGTTQTGVGITLGDSTANSGFNKMQAVMVTGFATGMRIGGATWLTCEKCEFGNAAGGLGTITNNVGIDFNFFGGNNYTSALVFKDCVVANNANAGVQATNVSITMNQVSWINCTVQNNCQSTTANAQFYMGIVLGFTIDNLYMEYTLGGTAPDALRSDNMANGQIRSLYCNTAANGIKDRGGGSMAHVDILAPEIFGITTGNAVNCASETDVRIRAPSITGTVSLTGSGCEVIPQSFITPNFSVNEVSFTPAIVGAGLAGATVAAAIYSQIGNTVTLSFRINWTGSTSPTGTVTITGLPIATKSGGPDVVLSVFAIGVTISSGYLAAEVPNGATTISLYNVQTTTASLQGTAFQNVAGVLIVSGSYQV